MNDRMLALAQAADRVSQLAHAAVDRPEYAGRVDEAVAALVEAWRKASD
jgi:hypothetical protein